MILQKNCFSKTAYDGEKKLIEWQKFKNALPSNFISRQFGMTLGTNLQIILEAKSMDVIKKKSIRSVFTLFFAV